MPEVESGRDLLPEEDREFLSAKGYAYSVVKEGGFLCLVLSAFPFPGFDPQFADLLIKLPPGYPMAQPDMFWTFPEIKLKTGGLHQAADQFETRNGQRWQRWSRHLGPNRWRAGVDNLQTYIGAIKAEFAKP